VNRALVAVTIALTVTPGCAGWKSQRAAHAPVSEKRKERHDTAVEDFEQQRDRAQLQAALDRWQQGDIAGCEARLRSLLARRPDFAEAHGHLAELAWSFENAAEAETEYRAALQLAPQRAEWHHALALVLEGSGRADEARAHLEQARRLEPDNEIYRDWSPTPGSARFSGL
jgi:Tfp pilus assembly protein PilF